MMTMNKRVVTITSGIESVVDKIMILSQMI